MLATLGRRVAALGYSESETLPIDSSDPSRARPVLYVGILTAAAAGNGRINLVEWLFEK